MKSRHIILNSISIAVLSTICVCFLLAFVPNVMDVEYITNTFVYPLENFVVEKSESLQFVLGTITYVLVYFFAGKAMCSGKIRNLLGSDLLTNVACWGFVIVSTILFYRRRLFVATVPIELRIVYLVSFVMAFTLGFHKTVDVEHKKIVDMFFFVCGIASIFIVSAFFVRESYFYGVIDVEYHVNAYFYPIWKLWCGQYPLIDFKNIYGYYPYLYCLIMQFMGGVTLERFCYVTAIFVAITFLAIMYVLWSVCKKKYWAFLGLLSIEYILRMYHAEICMDFYLQYVPHRMIMLCLILAIACMYVKNNEKKGHYSKRIEILGWICAGIALLWNLDTGIVVWLGWGIFLCFLYLQDEMLFSKKACIFIVKTILKCIITAVISYGILFIGTSIATGQTVDIAEAFYGQSVFYSSGFNMLRMKLLHPWMLAMALYAIGIAISIIMLKDLDGGYNCENKRKMSLYFIVAVVGVGAFLYYQGRSHDFVFVLVVWPAIILLAMLLDDIGNEWEKGHFNTSIFLKISVKTVFSFFSAALMMFSVGYIYYIVSPEHLINLKNKEISSSIVHKEIAVIENGGFDITNLDLLTEYAAEVYENYGIRYMPNVQGEIDIFTYEDVKELQEYLEITDKDVIIDAKMLSWFWQTSGKSFNEQLNEKFEVEGINGYWLCRHK